LQATILTKILRSGTSCFRERPDSTIWQDLAKGCDITRDLASKTQDKDTAQFTKKKKENFNGFEKEKRLDALPFAIIAALA